MQLVELFGSTRDDWMKEDIDGWLNANGIYAGLPEMLQHVMKAHELYIVTTKQVTSLLLSNQLASGHRRNAAA